MQHLNLLISHPEELVQHNIVQHLNLLISHPEEKRSKNSETDEVFEALEMAEDVGLKLQRVLDKLEKLDKIEAHLSEVSASLASIEEKVSRLDEDVQDLKQKNKQSGKESVRIGRKYPVQRRRHFRPKERVKGVKV